MFQAIAALLGSGMNLASGVNASDANRYQRYLNDRNAVIYAAQQERLYRTYTNIALVVTICIVIIILVLLLKRTK